MVKEGTQREPPGRDRIPQQHCRRVTNPLQGNPEADGQTLRRQAGRENQPRILQQEIQAILGRKRRTD